MERRALFIGAAIVMAAGSVPYMVIPRLAGNAIDEALARAQGEVAFIVGQIVLAGAIGAVLHYFALYLAEKTGRVTEYRLRNDFLTSSRVSTSGSTTARRPET